MSIIKNIIAYTIQNTYPTSVGNPVQNIVGFI